MPAIDLENAIIGNARRGSARRRRLEAMFAKKRHLVAQLEATGDRIQWTVREVGGVAVSKGIVNPGVDPDPALPPGMVRVAKAFSKGLSELAFKEGDHVQTVAPGPFEGAEACAYNKAWFSLGEGYSLEATFGSDPQVMELLREGWRWDTARGAYAQTITWPLPEYLQPPSQPTLDAPSHS